MSKWLFSCSVASVSRTTREKGVRMRHQSLAATVLLSVAFSISGPSFAQAQFYDQHNLLSDGFVTADNNTRSELVNAWGLVSSATSPWWIVDNGTGMSTIYNAGANTFPLAPVTVPGANAQQGKPTGIVFNGGSGFQVTTTLNNVPTTGPAR